MYVIVLLSLSSDREYGKEMVHGKHSETVSLRHYDLWRMSTMRSIWDATPKILLKIHFHA